PKQPAERILAALERSNRRVPLLAVDLDCLDVLLALEELALLPTRQHDVPGRSPLRDLHHLLDLAVRVLDQPAALLCLELRPDSPGDDRAGELRLFGGDHALYEVGVERPSCVRRADNLAHRDPDPRADFSDLP